MAKKKDNYLDYIPRPNTLFECNKNKDGKIEIKMHNKGVFNKIAQMLFKKPKYSYIELDEFGSFVWEQMDGKKTIYEIGTLVKEKFGDKAESETVLQYKKELSEIIAEILKTSKLPFKTCKYCGRKLRWNYKFGICSECHNAARGRRRHHWDEFY